MRFRIKSGQSARRFVFDRTPAPAKPPQPSAPRAADLDNPYGRYYGTARGPLKKQTRPLTQSCRTALCGSSFCRVRPPLRTFLFSIFVFFHRTDLKYSPL